MSLGELLTSLRIKKNMNRKELSKSIDIPYSSLSNYETDQRYPDRDTLIKFADYYNVTTDKLLGRTNTSNVDLSNSIPAGKQIKIPIIGTISAGLPILAEENIIDYAPMDSRFKNKGELFYLEVKGDSMNNCINEGDMILVLKQNHVDNGDIAVVLVNGDEATVKKVNIEGNFMTLYPDSTNPIHEPKSINLKNEHAEIIGIVLHSGRLINQK